MSLQSDFELCLEYAEQLEAKQGQRIEAQNNIIFIQNESERIKNKVKVCTTLTVLAVIGIVITALLILGKFYFNPIECIPFLGIFIVFFVIILTIRIKTKKESHEFEARKPSLIQRYTAEAESCEREMVDILKEIDQEDLFDIVPGEYFYVAAIEFCLGQVRKKLANTAAEAFRQLNAEIKRVEQMEYLEQMNSERMEQLESIKRAIEINTLVTSIAEENRNKNNYKY